MKSYYCSTCHWPVDKQGLCTNPDAWTIVSLDSNIYKELSLRVLDWNPEGD